MAKKAPNAGLVPRTQQAGTLVAATIVPITFQRTLMPRSTMDQALVTGISSALNYGFAALVQDTIEAVSLRIAGGAEPERIDRHTWRRVAIAVDLAAAGVGFAAQLRLKQSPDERLPRGVVRTAAWWVSASGVAGAIVGLGQELFGRGIGREDRSIPIALPAGMLLAGVNEYRRRRWEGSDEGHYASEDAQASAFKAFGIGAGVTSALSLAGWAERLFAAGVSRALTAVLPGSGRERILRPLGHIAALSVIGFGVYTFFQRVDRRIEGGATGIEEAFASPPASPEVSGGPGSLVRWESLSKQGRRNVSTALPGALIEEVMGEPARAEPIRVFVGLASAPTERDRVDLAMAELERTKAFDRALLMVISPTGTGYVNYVAVEAAEYLTRGNMASVAMQYSLRPSPLSLDRVDEGRRHYRMLIDAIHNRLRDVPADKRPRVVLFGESLGAWTSQDAFEHRGTQGLRDSGIDRAIWIGSPYMSKWKEQVLKSDRPDVDRTLIGRFNDIEQLERLAPEARESLRYVMITHDNDAVAHFGLDLLARAPDWLGPEDTRPASVPKSEQWRSPTTFIQTLVDMKNAANVIPGQFEAKGHDYRADLARFVKVVYDLRATDDQMKSIEAALRANELRRKEMLDAQKKKKEEEAASKGKGRGRSKAAASEEKATSG
jgi:uncharacterized membrane protein